MISVHRRWIVGRGLLARLASMRTAIGLAQTRRSTTRTLGPARARGNCTAEEAAARNVRMWSSDVVVEGPYPRRVQSEWLQAVSCEKLSGPSSQHEYRNLGRN